MQRVGALQRGGQAPAMRAVIEDMRGASDGDPERLAELNALLGVLEHALGNHIRALAAWEQSLLFAEKPSVLLRLATASREMGQLRRAYLAFKRLCAIDEDPARYCEHAARLQQGP